MFPYAGLDICVFESLKVMPAVRTAACMHRVPELFQDVARPQPVPEPLELARRALVQHLHAACMCTSHIAAAAAVAPRFARWAAAPQVDGVRSRGHVQCGGPASMLPSGLGSHQAAGAVIRAI